ncbi:protein jag [Tetragenococcus halophilus]|uniref:RNA-binding protein KhpB n=1 Tax=Tetragenococcus halophilus TaxID=51669 RepID=A0A3G5FG40_TETHA|nr:RNA-binding cell elongation regulator Jag/EloR [Tetragenococcus halophilus]AYW49303.1 protein jag [Tetragenococcus halophilus]GBD62591.1 Jag protein homolog [Tetragenococcus halophilus subsp. flandriensis]
MPIYEGQSVEEAIQNGLKALGVTQDEVQTTIIEEGKKGFLGVGKKNAQVSLEYMAKQETENKTEIVNETEVEEEDSEKLTEEEIEPAEEVSDKEAEQEEKPTEGLDDQEALRQLGIYLTDITKELNAPATIKTTRDAGRIVFGLDTSKKGLLIGRHGKTLNALQYLAQVYIHRIAKNKLPIVVNVGDYRQKREDILERLAERTAEKVDRTGMPAFLEPMPAFERKQIHAVLSKKNYVTTHSEGDEPYRYLVVEPAKKYY